MLSILSYLRGISPIAQKSPKNLSLWFDIYIVFWSLEFMTTFTGLSVNKPGYHFKILDQWMAYTLCF